MQDSPLICQARGEVLLGNLNQRNILPGKVENSKIWCVMCHSNLILSLLIPVYVHFCLYIYL